MDHLTLNQRRIMQVTNGIAQESSWERYVPKTAQRLSPWLFHAIGGALAATGLGLVQTSIKWKRGAPLGVAGGLVVTLLGAASLYAGDQLVERQVSIAMIQERVQSYREEGRYPSALALARTAYEQSIDLDLIEETAYFETMCQDLEKELLTLGYSRMLFDANGQPRAKLLELLGHLGMPAIENPERAIDEINGWAQQNLLRQGERWHPQTTRFEPLKETIYPLLSELGFVEANDPHFTEYEGALVVGGLLPGVVLRINYLVTQWTQGVRFSHLFFLSGARPLEADRENLAAIASSLKEHRNGLWQEAEPTTECEMMELVWAYAPIPEDLRQQVKVHFLNVPMQRQPQSHQLVRPTSDDTIRYWNTLEPAPGRYLAVSNAPYLHRQDLLIRGFTSKEYGFDTVGPRANDQLTALILLDEVARAIFYCQQAVKET